MKAITPEQFPSMRSAFYIPQPAPVHSHRRREAEYEDFFRQYAAAEKRLCRRDPSPMDLKAAHTFRVLENAAAIAEQEHFPAETARACRLAALFHDLSRFDQYRLWGTFRDGLSCNHGELSAYLLKETGILGEEPLAEDILAAAAIHNMRSLPDGLPPQTRIVACAVRDADRLDIMRIIDLHLAAKKDAEADVIVPFPGTSESFSQTVIDAVLKGIPASYADLRSANDFRLLAAGWFYLMSFPSSRRLAATAGHARNLAGNLPPPYETARDRLLADLLSAQ